MNIQTLRYYERRGLLHAPQRRPSGYREYSPEAVRVIRFVKHAQELGFTLAEVEDLLRPRTDQRTSCAEVRATASAKIADIGQKLRRLRAMKHALQALVDSCTTDSSARICPILEALDDEHTNCTADSRKTLPMSRSIHPASDGRTHKKGEEP